MRISIREVKDYIRCPLYYKFLNVDGITRDMDINDYYKDNIKTSIYYYYFSMIEKKEKSFESILRKWESLWFTDELIEMFGEDTIRKKSTDAVNVFSNFYKRIGSEPIVPIAVNFDYEVVFQGEPNIHVTGDIDLIKISNDRTRSRETQIVFFTTSRTYKDELELKKDIELSVASNGFRNSFKDKEDKIVLNNIFCENDSVTTRSGTDFQRAGKIIKSVCKAIRNNIFYPSENRIMCSGCQYKLFCLNEKSIP